MTGPRALDHLRVLDVTQELGYASKLFADMGAEVIMVEPPEGVAARRRGPFLEGAGADASLHFQYLAAGKRSVVLDLERAEDQAAFRALAESADIVIDDQLQSVWEARGLGYATLAPGLVWCAVTWFGQTGPRAGERADAFTAMAAGGMAWLTGYEDTGPLVVEGELATYAAAQYAAVMSLLAALGRDRAGGQFIDVSVQEVVALGTETAPQFYELKGVMRRRAGERERQAGIGLYPCRDGFVLLYAADSGLGTGWTNLVRWLVDAGVGEAACLHDAQWQDNAFKATEEARRVFRTLFARFAATRGRQELFEDGQRRHIAIAPINDAAAALADPHLAACGFFTTVGEISGRPVWGPGAPYRLGATPWQAGARAPFLGEHRLEEMVGTARAAGPGSAGLPLAGIRVIDFTWVGAGPFTTKILADFGAEVVKIESATRPDQLRRAEPLVGGRGLNESGYFAVRNTNKKSITIDMKRPGARDLVLALAKRADVVANSFSPRAMERFGLSYAEMAAVNPGLVYLSMPMAGATGPYRDYIGYGMSIAAIVGMLAKGGRPGRTPVGTGTNYPDHLPNPLHATFASLAALAYRARTGVGQEIVVSQIESTLASFPDALLDAAANGAGSRDAHASGLQGVFRCAGEDRWCAVSVEPEVAAAAIGWPGSACHSEEALAAWMAGQVAEEACARLQAARVAACVVETPQDLLERDAQLAARGFWQRLEHPVMGRSVYHGIAARFSGTPTTYRHPAPLLGQHNAELAGLAGLDAGAVDALAAAGVIH